MYKFRLRFRWSLFPVSNQQYSNIGLDNGLAPAGWQAIMNFIYPLTSKGLTSGMGIPFPRGQRGFDEQVQHISLLPGVETNIHHDLFVHSLHNVLSPN